MNKNISIYYCLIYNAGRAISGADSLKNAINAYKNIESCLHSCAYIQNTISYCAYKKACFQMLNAFYSVYRLKESDLLKLI